MEKMIVLDKARLAHTQFITIEVGEQEIIVCEQNGNYFAFPKRCPHKGASFIRNGDLKIENGCIRCQQHVVLFDLTTGIVVENRQHIPHIPSLATLPITVHEDELHILVEVNPLPVLN